MFTVTGASGHLGRLVIQHLLQRVPASAVLALTRHPERLADLAAIGVTVRHADFADPASLPAAFAGATRMLIVSTNSPMSDAHDSHRVAIEAAAAVGVAHIAYTSAQGADPAATSGLARDHGLTEAALAASDIPWTALRNSFYAEGLAQIVARSCADGTLLFPEGDAKTYWVTREDCARVAAAVLAGTTDPSGPVDVTGPEGLSFGGVAERLAALSGRAVPVRHVSAEEYIAHLAAIGMPGPVAPAPPSARRPIRSNGSPADRRPRSMRPCAPSPDERSTQEAALFCPAMPSGWRHGSRRNAGSVTTIGPIAT